MKKAQDFFTWIETRIPNNREKRQLYTSMIYQNKVPSHVFTYLKEEYKGTEEEYKEQWNVIYTMLMMLQKQMPNRKTKKTYFTSFIKDKQVRRDWFENTLKRFESMILAQEHALKPKKIKVEA